MSYMKCPFCNQELEIWHTNKVRMYACPDLTCKGYYMSATKDMWQELIHTRKALDLALNCLNGVTKDLPWVKRTLEQITALEQKDK